MPQNHTITITNGDPVTGILTLSDHGQTDVDPSDTVTWIIGQNSGVGSITAISDDPNSTDVFNPDPALVGGSTNWKGTINPSIAKGTIEDYTICWKTSSGTTPPCYDPKIAVNP